MHSIMHEHFRFCLVKNFISRAMWKCKLFLMPNFIGHNWPIKIKTRGVSICMSLLEASYQQSFSSLQRFNKPSCSIHGQTDIAMALCATVSSYKPQISKRTSVSWWSSGAMRNVLKSTDSGIKLFTHLIHSLMFNIVDQLDCDIFLGESSSKPWQKETHKKVREIWKHVTR